MDASLSVRPASPQVPGQPRAEFAPAPNSVRTELPQLDQSVAAMQEQSKQDPAYARPKVREQRGSALSDETGRELDREIEYNRETKDMVLRRVDRRTGRVVDQFPSESRLQIRAYLRSQIAEKAEAVEMVSKQA
jgi:uncharacterized FlaG/YvyC family protein